MEEKLEKIKSEGLKDIENATSIEELQEIRKNLMGKKSKLNEVMKTLGSMDASERRTIGIKTTEIKNVFSLELSNKEKKIIESKSVLDKPIDLTIPGHKISRGVLHPLTQMYYDLNDAFLSLGFEVFSEDDISSEKFAFDNLNFPPDHPARQMMDTYWIDGTENKSGCEKLCLRPHLTGASVRYLLKHKAPARFVYPGRVYRNEDVDSGHERAFFQYEALIVDKNISFSSGMVMIKTILEKVFGCEVKTRMREGFFPFVEPGYEIDMECLVCGGKGCSVCKHNGWLEIMPGGVIHPNVLKAAGLDPEEWTGFYINIGLERLVMMRYGVDDIRLFHSADLRFLEQFK